MINNDYRFKSALFKCFINKVFKSYTHKKYFQGHDVGQLCSFKIDDDDYLLINNFIQFDYLGKIEDKSVWKIVPIDQSDVKLDDNIIISDISSKINEIDLIEDDVLTIIEDNAKFHIKETRAIIFKLEDYEIAFEKADCPFSIEIYIYKGHNLIDIILKNPTFASMYNQIDDYNVKLERKIITIK